MKPLAVGQAQPLVHIGGQGHGAGAELGCRGAQGVGGLPRVAPLYASAALPAGPDLDAHAQDMGTHGRDVGLVLVGDGLKLDAAAA